MHLYFVSVCRKGANAIGDGNLPVLMACHVTGKDAAEARAKAATLYGQKLTRAELHLAGMTTEEISKFEKVQSSRPNISDCEIQVRRSNASLSNAVM